jgi:hypothetical protein
MPSTVTDRLAGLTTSVAVKAPVKAVSTANVTLSGLQTVGGVALAEGDRVLLKDQSTASENGIYVASATTWTRAKDFDGARDVVQGSMVVANFDNGAGLLYRVATADPIVVGSTGLTILAIADPNRIYDLVQTEVSDSITPANYAYPPGDPRRYHSITVTDEEISGLYCRGFVPTYVDSDTFTLAGDRTAAFPDRTRIAVFNNSGVRTYCQVLSTSYSAPNTTVQVRTEIGNLPADPVAVLNYVGIQLAHMNTVMVDYDAAQVFQIVNKNTGSSAATQLFVGDFDASGIGIIATKSTTVGTYPGGVFYSLAPNNPIAAITTGLPIPLVFVTHDRARLILDGDGLQSQFTTSLLVQQTNENPNGSSTSTITVDGTATAAMSWQVAGVEYGFMLVDDERVILGSSAPDGPSLPVPLHLYTDGEKRLGIPVDGIEEFADDAAAASGGLALLDVYRTGSTLKARIA